MNDQTLLHLAYQCCSQEHRHAVLFPSIVSSAGQTCAATAATTVVKLELLQGGVVAIPGTQKAEAPRTQGFWVGGTWSEVSCVVTGAQTAHVLARRPLGHIPGTDTACIWQCTASAGL